MYELQYRNKAGIRSMYFPIYADRDAKRLLAVMKGRLRDNNARLLLSNSKPIRGALNDNSVYK